MSKEKNTPPFHFKQFSIEQDLCTMKVGTDAVLLGAWVPGNTPKSILDIGAGSGVISIMLAQRFPTAKITGVEIDFDSALQCENNMLQSPWSDRLETINSSIQEFHSQEDRGFDLIVSNPPFFTGGTISLNADRNAVRHTIKLSHHDLLSAVKNLLADDGHFCVVLPYIEGLRFQELARSYHLYPHQVLEVRPTAPKPLARLLIALGKKPRKTITQQLVIQNKGRNDWTEAYIELTKSFYLNL